MRHTDPNGNVSIPSVPSSSSSSSSSWSSGDEFPFQDLDCYKVARALAALTQRAGISDPELRDQATRAAKSAFLNLSEGLPSDLPGVRRRYFRQSDGSLHEVVAAVDLAAVLGAVDPATAAEIQQLGKRLRDMLRGLLRADAGSR